MTTDQPHGTWDAYRQHLAHGQEPCLPCWRYGLLTERFGPIWEAERELLLTRRPAVAPDQMPVAVRELTAQGWTDRRIAELLRTTVDRVRNVRRRHRIDAGVPQGYRSRDEIREPA